MRSDITSVDQLSGKKIAVHSETSFTKTVAELIIKQDNLQNVQLSIVPGSEVRAQALLSGQIDATILDIQDVVLAQHQKPGAIRVLVNFSDLYPALCSVRWVTNKAWIDANPALAREIVKAMVLADRQAVDNPEATIKDAIATYPDSDPVIVTETVKAFIDGKHWILNGGMSPANGLAELKFYFDAGQTKVPATPENVAKLYRTDILDSVLAEVGIRPGN